MMRLSILLLLVLTGPALAHHPGERLDEVMAQKEAAFEATDLRETPALELEDADGLRFALKDLGNQIVILSFVPELCGEVCARQQTRLASVQEQVNITPMKSRVTFLTLRDSESAVPSAWVPGNWQLVTPTDGQSAAMVGDRFSALSGRPSDSPQIHVIDRNGRHAGIFHGAEFEQTSLLHYINGLTNAPDPGRDNQGWWESVKGLFQ